MEKRKVFGCSGFIIGLILWMFFTGMPMGNIIGHLMISDVMAEQTKYPIQYRESLTDQMCSVEQSILDVYNDRADHSPENAYIVLNAYGNAPLTAIAMFETESSCEISVCIKGKTPEMDIAYTVNDSQREHQIGIWGLYAGYDNTVEITVEGKTFSYSVVTEELPEDMTRVHKDPVGGDETCMEHQMILLQDGWYTLFDQNGDIRWYLDNKWHTTAVSGAFTVDADQNGIWFTYGTTKGSPYRDGAQLIHMEWFGKIEGIYSYDGYCAHHCIELLPNGNLLYPGGHDGGENQFLELNPETGEIEIFLDLNQVSWLDPSVGNINPRSEEKLDWAHPNSIQYVGERECYLISLRNQHMLINLDGQTKMPNWILTSACSVDEQGVIQAWQEAAIPYLIVPDEEFEWFYTQHDMKYVGGDETSMEFTIFDNGSLRYVGKELNKELDDGQRFSRMLRLRVDEVKRTVEIIFQFGKEEGKYLFSRTFGNTEFIAENGHYLGSFVCKNDIYQEVSKVVEVNGNGELVSCYSIGKIEEGLYRANPIVYDLLNYHTNFRCEGVEVHQYQQQQWQEITLPEDCQNYEKLHISDIYRDESTISIYGRALVDEKYVVDQIYLILTDSKGKTYGFPMVSTQRRGGGFYGVGIPLTGLPEETYEIAVATYGEDGGVFCMKIRETMMIGD